MSARIWWPLDVALSVMTGRRVDLSGRDELIHELMTHLAGGEITPQQSRDPEFFAEIRDRAWLAFPELREETGDELDANPFLWRSWLEERKALYGEYVIIRRLTRAPDALEAGR